MRCEGGIGYAGAMLTGLIHNRAVHARGLWGSRADGSYESSFNVSSDISRRSSKQIRGSSPMHEKVDGR